MHMLGEVGKTNISLGSIILMNADELYIYTKLNVISKYVVELIAKLIAEIIGSYIIVGYAVNVSPASVYSTINSF